jgi:hypothetical protein
VLLDQAKLTKLEKSVIDAAREGLQARPPEAMCAADLAVTTDDRLLVRAEVIRDALMGRWGELDPRGFRAAGIRVVGHLDLEHVTAVTGLHLTGCVVPDGIKLAYARITEVNFAGSCISGIVADGLHTDGPLGLSGVEFSERIPAERSGSSVHTSSVRSTSPTPGSATPQVPPSRPTAYAPRTACSS